MRLVVCIIVLILYVFCAPIISRANGPGQTPQAAKERLAREQLIQSNVAESDTSELLSRLILELSGVEMSPESYRRTITFVRQMGVGYGAFNRDGFKWQLGMFALAAAEQNKRIKELEKVQNDLLNRLSKLESQITPTPSSK